MGESFLDRLVDCIAIVKASTNSLLQRTLNDDIEFEPELVSCIPRLGLEQRILNYVQSIPSQIFQEPSEKDQIKFAIVREIKENDIIFNYSWTYWEEVNTGDLNTQGDMFAILDKYAEPRDVQPCDQHTILAPIVIHFYTRSHYHELIQSVFQYLIDSIKTQGGGVPAAIEFSRIAQFIMQEAIIPPWHSCLSLSLSDQSVEISTEKFPWIQTPNSAISEIISHCISDENIQNVISIWKAVLGEKLVTLVSDSEDKLFKFCEAIKILLYPLDNGHFWRFIPVVPSDQVAIVFNDIHPGITGVINCSEADFDQLAEAHEKGHGGIASIIYDIDQFKIWKKKRNGVEREVNIWKTLENKLFNNIKKKLSNLDMDANERQQRFQLAFMKMFLKVIGKYDTRKNRRKMSLISAGASFAETELHSCGLEENWNLSRFWQKLIRNNSNLRDIIRANHNPQHIDFDLWLKRLQEYFMDCRDSYAYEQLEQESVKFEIQITEQSVFKNNIQDALSRIPESKFKSRILNGINSTGQTIKFYGIDQFCNIIKPLLQLKRETQSDLVEKWKELPNSWQAQVMLAGLQYENGETEASFNSYIQAYELNRQMFPENKFSQLVTAIDQKNQSFYLDKKFSPEVTELVKNAFSSDSK